MAKTIKQRELNLLIALDKSKAKKGMSGHQILTIVAAILVVILLASLAVLFSLKMAELSDRRDELALYLNDSATQTAYDKAQQAEQRAMAMQAQADALTQSMANLATYPNLAGGGLRQVFEIAGDNVELSNIAYDGSTGILTFAATCDSPTRVPVFMAQLRMCDIFSDVNYVGYAGDILTIPGTPTINEDGTVSSNNIVSKKFDFNVQCLVKAPEPAEDGTQDAKAGDGNE
jgi:hypothetical protein